MDICRKCDRKQHLTGDKFCYGCGAELVDGDVTCSCGRILPPLYEFCPSCGKRKQTQVEVTVNG